MRRNENPLDSKSGQAYKAARRTGRLVANSLDRILAENPSLSRIRRMEVKAMTRIKSHAWLIAVLLLAVMGVIVTFTGRASTQPTQDAERTLGIERYPNEPLELVDIKVSEQSVKGKIKIGPRYKGQGTDSTKFKGEDGWFKNLRVRLRNVSGRPIYRVKALLLFKPSTLQMFFSIPLIHPKESKQEPLQPGAEIDLVVRGDTLNRMMETMQQHSVDANTSSVSISVDDAYFSNELKWSRGVLLRRDPNDPNRWNVVDTTKPTGIGQRGRQTVFIPVALKPVAYRPQALTQCQEARGGEITTQCGGDDSGCVRVQELGNGAPGNLSAFPESGTCDEGPVDHPEIVCDVQTTHSRLSVDSSCPPPCPDRDGDGYRDEACGGNDCNDIPNQGGSINPGASESCYDGIDNNCNGLTDSEDCVCKSEGPEYQAGGDADCYPCRDGEDNDCDGEVDLDDLGCFSCWPSPVLIDVSGNGFNLTNGAGGVNFDLNSDNIREKLSWTSAGSDDGWLALDRNGNGTIDNGQELFGNFTPQPAPPPSVSKNGFNALGVYDSPAEGGNGDGVIDSRDAIFSRLRLWQDINHNGMSEPNELRPLPSLSVARLHLDYKESKRVDEHGNQFSYRAKVDDAKKAKVGRWAWDIFLVSENTAIVQPLLQRPLLFQLWVPSLTLRVGHFFKEDIVKTAKISRCGLS